jgi:cellulose biosynthesis protein BcsQ
MAIIAMTNQKGGCGKTACTVNLAAALALKGKKVAVIDNDPQSNATSILLRGEQPSKTLYSIYMDGTPIEQCVYPSSFGVFVIPNSKDTAITERKLYRDIDGSYQLLKNSARDYCNENFDVTLIDTPPTLGIWVLQALICADGVIVPVEAGSAMSLEGLTSVYEAVKDIAEEANPNLQFLKALINKVDLRLSASKIIVETLRTRFPGQTFDTTIPQNTAIQQAEILHTTVLRHEPQCSASKRFRELAAELIDLAENRQLSLNLSKGK